MTFAKVLKSQSFKNTAWTLFGAVVYPAFVLATTPFFINRLGEEQFGIWILINSTLQIITALNFGLGDAIIKLTSQYSANTDYERINRVISTCLFSTGVISFIVVSVGLPITYFVEAHNLFDVDSNNIEVFSDSLALALLLFVLKFLDINFLAIFQGFNRYDMSSRLSLMCRILTLGANFVCVILGLNLVAIFMSTLVTQIIFLGLEIWAVKRNYPEIRLRPTVNKNALKSIFSFGIWSWLQSLAAMVTIQIDKLIVGYFSGVETLSYYSIGSMVAMQLHTLFVSVSGWIFPAVSRKTESKESVSTFYFNSNAILLTFGYAMIALLILLGGPIMTLWLGPEIYDKSRVYIELFLFYNLFLLPQIMPYLFLNGSGFVRQNTMSEFSLKASNILLMVAFFSFFGNPGLVWGLIISTALNVPLKIFLLRKLTLKLKISFFGIEMLIPGSAVIFMSVADHAFLKAIAALTALLSFYFVFFKPSSIVAYISNVGRQRLTKIR